MILITFALMIVTASAQSSFNQALKVDQKKSIWFACYLSSYSFFEKERTIMENIAKVLNYKFKDVTLKFTIEMMESCTESMTFDESKTILENPKNIEIVFKENHKILNILKNRLIKNGVELSKNQMKVLEEMEMFTKELQINLQEQQKKQKEQSWFVKASEYAGWLGVIGTAAFGLPILAGFGTVGIAGSSLAAFWQATIGNVAGGSLFAVLTSLGMKGVLLNGVIGSLATAATGFAGMWAESN